MKTLLQIVLICLGSNVLAQTISLPPRASNAISGGDFIRKISALDFAQREQAVADEVLSGNLPTFQRTFCPVTVTNVFRGETNIATFFAAPDYLAVGSDADYFLAPVSPNTAQRIADKLDCILPTRKMADAIYAAAEVKLAPSPIPPTPAMTAVPIFAQINETIHTQRVAILNSHPLGALVVGHKKDVVISARLATTTNKVAIYGWHQTNGMAIQPLYLGHTTAWVDYSHGIRLVSQSMLVNGGKKSVAEVLADPKLCGLISDEGVVMNGRYQTQLVGTGLRPVVSGVAPETVGARESALGLTTNRPRTVADEIRRDAGFDGRDARATQEKITLPWPQKFSTSTNIGEMVREIKSPDEVRILINAPARESFAANRPVLLVFYALPNGNTIEQTIGKNISTNDDWHFNIQHIGAQTRWLRQVITNRTIVVAYLEAGMKSWPAWRKKYSDARIVEILEGVRGIFSSNKIEVVLASHSGGGSLIFGYLNAVEEIPGDVKRIAFLDSNYGYDSKLHAKKIINWLSASPVRPDAGTASSLSFRKGGEGRGEEAQLLKAKIPSPQPSPRLGGEREPNNASRFAQASENHLLVLAYQDYLGLLNGKSFVSEAGGTWGRSQVMLGDLGAQFHFTSTTNGGLETFTALDGRIEFLLKENPEHKIFHTIQVERNGFIHALLSGTAEADKGYEYFGERVYTHWIR